MSDSIMAPFFLVKNRRVALLGVLALTLLLTLIWSYTLMAGARDNAVAAASDLAATQRLSSRISQFRHLPSIAGAQELQQGEMAKRIELAARNAQMSADQVVRIWPETARRVGQSPYKEKPTQVLLHGMTLRQIVLFLHTLAAAESNGNGLMVRALRLTAPRDQERFDIWTVEATLTYYIFDPPGSGNPGSPGSPRKTDRTTKPMGGETSDSRKASSPSTGGATSVAESDLS